MGIRTGGKCCVVAGEDVADGRDRWRCRVTHGAEFDEWEATGRGEHRLEQCDRDLGRHSGGDAGHRGNLVERGERERERLDPEEGDRAVPSKTDKLGDGLELGGRHLIGAQRERVALPVPGDRELEDTISVERLDGNSAAGGKGDQQRG